MYFLLEYVTAIMRNWSRTATPRNPAAIFGGTLFVDVKSDRSHLISFQIVALALPLNVVYILSFFRFGGREERNFVCSEIIGRGVERHDGTGVLRRGCSESGSL
jgi:hypothetical protein